MKVIIRIPTEQYAYVEIVDDFVPESQDSAVEYITAFNEKVTEAFKREKTGPGLTDKEFNYFLDVYLTNGTGSSDVYAKMNLSQQGCIQAIKRSMKRIKRNPNEEEIE